MAKRQKRYQGTELNKADLSHLLNKKVNIVFKNGNVIFAQITAISESKIDVVNMRSKRSVAELKAIAEIILDFKG